MKVHIVYTVDDGEPLDVLVEGEDPAAFFMLLESAIFSSANRCLDHVRTKLGEQFLPDTGDARHK